MGGLWFAPLSWYSMGGLWFAPLSWYSMGEPSDPWFAPLSGTLRVVHGLPH